MNFGNKFPDENADMAQVLTYLVELRETLTAFSKSVDGRFKNLPVYGISTMSVDDEEEN